MMLAVIVLEAERWTLVRLSRFCVLYLAETSSNVAGILIQISESSSKDVTWVTSGVR